MFTNESPTDFSIAENREAFAETLNQVDQQIKSKELFAAPIVNGEVVKTEQTINSLDPSESEISVGTVYMAEMKHAAAALESLKQGAPSWADTPADDRADIIFQVATLMRQRRNFLSNLIIREAGKPWKEADADVVEAIDFCDYYALEMKRLATPQKTMEVLGEENIYLYQPRGIGVIISPWNFPLAIPCGMTVASLVTGNATILKPAEQTSLIAFEFAKILLEAGVPKDAFALLPGEGETIGAGLVEDPGVDLICFTGSMEVGLSILRTASEVRPGQRNIKKVITELGGKNAIICDEDGDQDEAVKGIIQSAFGYAGQKCSACSRLIIVGDAYERVLERLCEATADIFIGPAKQSETFIGPLIDEVSQKRVLEVIRRAEQECTLAYKGEVPSTGYYVPPTIFRDVPTKSFLWQEEQFAPVLACTHAKDFEHALELANSSKYALTGGMYSRSPQNIELARKKFKVGNLYINRNCTGAIVCRQPFGGFKMSGIGSKAGGPDYLLQFLEPRTITENTMRRGFSPDLV